VLIFLGAVATVLAETAEPVLRMEVGGHHAGIWSMALSPSNRILVTGSEDKTVRVWDIAGRGELLRILRPPVGEGEEGQIFGVALSPDERTVACGGRTGSMQPQDVCVYLFDRATGVLTRRLGGLPGFIHYLAYSRDGRFLAVATGARGGKGASGMLRLYRVPEYTVAAEDKNYGDMARWAEFDPTGMKLATTSIDGVVRLYDLSGLAASGGSSSPSMTPVSRIQPPGGQRPWGLAFSPDGTRLAVGQHFIPKVDVLAIRGNTLEPAYSPETKGAAEGQEIDFRTVAWSADSRFLYAGGGYRVKAVRQVRRWADGGRGEYTDLPVEVDLPLYHILPLQKGGLVFASRDGSFGTLNDRGEAALFAGRAIPSYAVGHEGFLLTPDGAGVQFPYEKRGRSPAFFAVSERRLEIASSSFWTALKAGFTFQAPITTGLEVSDWKTSMAPKLKGQPLPMKNESAESLAILPDRSAFVLGTSIALWLFDPAGKPLWRIRTPGAVWAVNTDGRVAVAALGDGTIRWYRIADGKEFLAFFPHTDRKRWVLWTPSGYYDASPGSEDFIGWQVNNGKERAADFFPASRFRSMFHRPDVIDRVIKTLDESAAVRQADEESGRKPAVAASVREKLPPTVVIDSPGDGTQVSASPVKLRYSARSREPLTGLKVLVDGRPVPAEGIGQTPKESGELTVAVPPWDCEVAIIAENRNAASEPAAVRLRWKGAAAKAEFEIKPKLYVLAVGVSQYQDPDMRLDLAAKDALDFGAAWNEQKGRLYSGVEVRVLTDAQAGKGNILDGLEWLQRQVTAKDVAVLFFAGHGVNDPTGMFYFLPVDADLEKLKRTGISQADITSTVASLAGKVLVFMDACHSGNLMGKLKRRGVVVLSAAINELASAENGAVVFSSATGKQYALENAEWGNGAFTKGVVEGLRGKADYRSTGRITVNMLDLYVSERVKELTKGQQTPTTVKPPNVPDFPVALMR
jgi:WD40 repeat protein